MTRDEVLTDLAKNLKEWPARPGSEGSMVKVPADKYVVEFPGIGGMSFTHLEWMQRREELAAERQWSQGEERIDRIAQSDASGDHYRELNPPGSSLTDSQAREIAEETSLCSDGSPCGSPHHPCDDAYCLGCPNQPAAYAEDSDAGSALSQAMREQDAGAHYRREYRGVKLDPYRIAKVYAMQGGPREQIMKKCLRFTDKGQTEQQVVDEIRTALNRWQEMLEEDGECK